MTNSFVNIDEQIQNDKNDVLLKERYHEYFVNYMNAYTTYLNKTELLTREYTSEMESYTDLPEFCVFEKYYSIFNESFDVNGYADYCMFFEWIEQCSNISQEEKYMCISCADMLFNVSYKHQVECDKVHKEFVDIVGELEEFSQKRIHKRNRDE